MLEHGNYRGLKLLDQIMKVADKSDKSKIREKTDRDAIQFDFFPVRGYN